MKLERYELKADEYLTTYDFLSEGPKGIFDKIVQFSLVNQNNIFIISRLVAEIRIPEKLMIGLSQIMAIAKKYWQL